MADELDVTLQDVRVGRLATVDERGRPHVVPIVFVFDAGVVYTPIDAKPKSAPPERLQRVRNIEANPNVQVLIDRYSEDWSELGYLQLRGRAELLESGAEHERAIALLEEKYEQYRDMPLAGRPVIKIAVEREVRWGKLR